MNTDGIVHRQPKFIKRGAVYQPVKQRRYYAAPQANSRGNLWLSRLQLPLIIVFAVVAGVLANSTLISQLLIVTYGIVAFALRIGSRHTFLLAILSLLGTVGLLIGKGNVAMAQNLATNTFLFLVVGVITITRELKKEGGFVYSRKRQ